MTANSFIRLSAVTTRFQDFDTMSRTPSTPSQPLSAPELQEAPVAVCINGICQSVMMISPTDIEAFAYGFVLTEGLIAHPNEILHIDSIQQELGWQVDVRVLAEAEHKLKQKRRLMAGPSGCGLCGVDSLESAMALPEKASEQKLSNPNKFITLDQKSILSAVDQLPNLQKQFACTRGHHGAAFFLPDAEFVDLAEDVSRHAALDKLIGRLAVKDSLPKEGFALLTSRCSHDLVLKASRAGIPGLVTLAPPTDLAVQSAQRVELPLICFKQGQMQQYV